MNREDYIHIDHYSQDIEALEKQIRELKEVIENYQVDEQHYIQTLERMEKRITFLEDDNRFLEALNIRRNT
jgi:DNA repair ATPase RecN